MSFKRRVQAYLTGSNREYFDQQKKRLRIDHDAKALRMILKEHKELTEKDTHDERLL